jgi:23S rRNA pseudouridine2604 synthase
VCSRREAEAFIAEGLVRIDGRPIADPGHKIAPGQVLTLADAGPAPFTAVLNKPAGYVSAQPERGQIPAARLLTKEALWGQPAPIPKRGQKLAPLGRLDQDSRGLLLLSEDGVLAKAVIGPQSALDKEYRVRVAGAITPKALALLRHGLSLDGRALKPAKVTQTGPQRLTFILTEGRNRQIRRMAEAVGLRVTDLKRVRIGPLALGDLPEGRWRALTADERDALMGRR